MSAPTFKSKLDAAIIVIEAEMAVMDERLRRHDARDAEVAALGIDEDALLAKLTALRQAAEAEGVRLTHLEHAAATGRLTDSEVLEAMAQLDAERARRDAHFTDCQRQIDAVAAIDAKFAEGRD